MFNSKLLYFPSLLDSKLLYFADCFFLSFYSYINRAACKTLIDSERRKNTQASSDVGARQLVRF